MQDFDTAQSLKKLKAEINIPNIPDKPPSFSFSTCHVDDADCEYLRATRQISGFLPDLVESLILKGGRQNWEAAAVELTMIRNAPDFGRDVQLQGQYLLLTLLLRLVRGQPDRDATHNWCSWVANNREVKGWGWLIWDHNVGRLRLSREALSKISSVEASAQGKPADELCARWSNR
jgi:hypothetical protein